MNIKIKTPEEIEIMAQGGAILRKVKNKLGEAVMEGVNAMEIETLANQLIEADGAQASFKKVPGYHWATCINTNSGLVHGIPNPGMVFKKGDVVSIDVGVYYKGFHTDTSITVGIDLTPENKKFLSVGKQALEKAISRARVDNYIYDISKAIEDTIEGAGYSTIKALVGHGVGRELHEDPQIPCFVPFDSLDTARDKSAQGKPDNGPKIKSGMA
jgi:methionyl aminopeptidase